MTRIFEADDARTLFIDEQTVRRDAEGFLLDPEDWSTKVAQVIAQELEVDMTDRHWVVVNFVRDWFEQNQTVPEARHALKAMQAAMGKENGSRRELSRLFPYGYGQQACMIAGMRKPLKLMLDV